MRPPITAPGTIPTTTNRRSSGRMAERRATPAARHNATKMVAASATVCQRIVTSPRRSTGSKSSAMTAIGTGESVADGLVG